MSGTKGVLAIKNMNFLFGNKRCLIMYETNNKAYRFLHIDRKELDLPAKVHQLFTHQDLYLSHKKCSNQF